MSNVDKSKIVCVVSDARHSCALAIESVKSCNDAQALKDLDRLREQLGIIDRCLNPWEKPTIKDITKEEYDERRARFHAAQDRRVARRPR